VFAACCTRKSSVGDGGSDRRKRRSGNPEDLRSVRTSQREVYSIVALSKRLCTSSKVPEIWMVKGFGGISNFTLFRIPSQPLTPLDVTDRRNCPSCTTSIQPAAERLMV
jgi:hypothetical protein